MKKCTIKKNNIRKDCWNLDQAFLKWLEEHLRVYLKDASNFVDLTYHKFTYKDKEYTQHDIILRMLHLLEQIRYKDSWDKDYPEAVDEILDLWKLVFHSMWW